MTNDVALPITPPSSPYLRLTALRPALTAYQPFSIRDQRFSLCSFLSCPIHNPIISVLHKPTETSLPKYDRQKDRCLVCICVDT